MVGHVRLFTGEYGWWVRLRRGSHSFAPCLQKELALQGKAENNNNSSSSSSSNNNNNNNNNKNNNNNNNNNTVIKARVDQ